MLTIFSEPDLAELQDFAQFQARNPPGASLLSYACGALTPDLAIAVCRLFWPAFREYQGGVFRTDQFDEASFNQWWERLDGDLAAIERVMNHVHLRDLPFSGEWGKANLLYFGTILTHCWRAALEAQFPKRRFQVQGEWDEAGEDFIITFWQG